MKMILEFKLLENSNSDIFKGTMNLICKTYNINKNYDNLEFDEDRIYISIDDINSIILFELYRRKLIDQYNFIDVMKTISRITLYKILNHFLSNINKLENNEEFIDLLDDILYNKNIIDKILT